MDDAIGRWVAVAAILVFLLWCATEALASEAIPPDPVVRPAAYHHPETTP